MADIIYEKHPEGHYAVFTMNRPERLNALGRQLGKDLNAAMVDFTADPDMRVGILTGTGRAFSAGADLREMSEGNTEMAEIERQFKSGEINGDLRIERLREIGRATLTGGVMMMEFSRNPKPFIAAINGLAIGGGCERALDCDIRIASTASFFALYEVKRGILAGYAIHNLARTIPFGEAMYMLLTADNMSPQEAHRIGLVHEVVEPDQLLPRAVEIAEMIAANAPLAVQGTKAVAQFWRQLGMDESQRLGAWVSRQVMNSDDAKEGPLAFAEKRTPVWQAR